MPDPKPVTRLTDEELAAEAAASRQRQADLTAELEARAKAEPEVRYFAHVGGERIELGQDVRLKEDPFKPLHTGREIGHWEAERTIDGTRYVAVSNDSLEDAAARLDKQLPEDVKPPDRTKKVTVTDQVKGTARTGGKSE